MVRAENAEYKGDPFALYDFMDRLKLKLKHKAEDNKDFWKNEMQGKEFHIKDVHCKLDYDTNKKVLSWHTGSKKGFRIGIYSQFSANFDEIFINLPNGFVTRKSHNLENNKKMSVADARDIFRSNSGGGCVAHYTVIFPDRNDPFKDEVVKTVITTADSKTVLFSADQRLFGSSKKSSRASNGNSATAGGDNDEDKTEKLRSQINSIASDAGDLVKEGVDGVSDWFKSL